MTIEIADRLIKLRKKYGYSQEELADKLGLSRQAVSKWERAEASPDTDNLICLAKLYGVSLDELLSTDDSVETIVKEQVKTEEGIHIVDDEGNQVHIHDKHITLTDEHGNKITKDHFMSEFDKKNVVLTSILGGVALITYIMLGIFLNMWWNAWVVFFVPEIISSIVRLIHHKNFNKFNMAFTACFVFFFVCIILPGTSSNLWHPMWTVFLLIPVYYSIVGSINKALGKKDDEEKCDCYHK